MIRRIMTGTAFILIGGVLFDCGETPPSNKTESYEAKDLIAFVKDAAALVETDGEAAFAEFRKKDGKWFQGELYVFVNDSAGSSVCQPASPEMEGKDLSDLRDAMGKPLVRHMINAVSGEGREG